MSSNDTYTASPHVQLANQMFLKGHFDRSNTFYVMFLIYHIHLLISRGRLLFLKRDKKGITLLSAERVSGVPCLGRLYAACSSRE